MTTFTEQRFEALERANQVRSEHANIKASIAGLPAVHGRRMVANMLIDSRPELETMRIGRLLGSIRRVGRGKTTEWLNTAEIRSADRRVGELSPRQRLRLASSLLRGQDE